MNGGRVIGSNLNGGLVESYEYFRFKEEEIRETILLQTPLFIECSEGKSPERALLTQFFKKESPPSKDEATINFPFADLE